MQPSFPITHIARVVVRKRRGGRRGGGAREKGGQALGVSDGQYALESPNNWPCLTVDLPLIYPFPISLWQDFYFFPVCRKFQKWFSGTFLIARIPR